VVDALDAATQVLRWATARGGEKDPLALRAGSVVSRASGRFTALIESSDPGAKYWTTARRASFHLQAMSAESQQCPADATGSLDVLLPGLDAEPPAGSTVPACWDSFVGSALQQISATSDPLVIARAILAFADRPRRAAEAATLTTRLRELVLVRPSGNIVLAEPWASDRAARSIILAALVRSARIGADQSSALPMLIGWMLVQRDADGGFGSSSATRAAVRALVSTPLADDGPAHVVVRDAAGKVTREIDLAPRSTATVPLNPATQGLVVETTGPGVLALLTRPALRPWTNPPPEATSPVRIETTWPAAPRHDGNGVLRVSLRHSLGREAVIRARMPLPPGTSLAEEVIGVRQVQGALLITTALTATADPTLVDIPLRFTLAGKVTVPEAVAHLANEDAPFAYAPARPLTIE
jgi:hypothetical protein